MVEKNYDFLDVDFEDENLKIEKDEKVFIVSVHNPTSQNLVIFPNKRGPSF